MKTLIKELCHDKFSKVQFNLAELNILKLIKFKLPIVNFSGFLESFVFNSNSSIMSVKEKSLIEKFVKLDFLLNLIFSDCSMISIDNPEEQWFAIFYFSLFKTMKEEKIAKKLFDNCLMLLNENITNETLEKLPILLTNLRKIQKKIQKTVKENKFYYISQFFD